MQKFLLLGALLAAMLVAVPAMAQEGPATDETTPAETTTEATASGDTLGSNAQTLIWVFPGGASGIYFGAALGAGLVVFGAARGIGRIGGSATESIARQPEAGGQIFTAMLLSAALIEGVALFGVVVTLLVALK